MGATIQYLQKLQIDKEMLLQRNFKVFDLHRGDSKTLIMGGQVLKNLNILENEQGREEGSLLHYLDHTITPFGRHTAVYNII